MMELIEVCKTYAAGTAVTAVRDVSLRIAAGDYLGIIGASGSGKSTLLHLLGLLDRPSSGRILVEGRDAAVLPDTELARLRGRMVGFVFQSFHLIGHLSVRENVALPLFYQRVPPRERLDRADQHLAAVGMSHRRHHRPAQLSGGERQRTAIARALIGEPRLILADEPTGNLDSRTGAEILALFDDLHARGRTLVVITHDPAIAGRLPRVVRMRDGVLTPEARS